MAELMYREALNQALAEEMRRDPLVFAMGEGIAERGGSYKVTEGLVKEFGPERVVDTPISEASFTGCGVGAADALTFRDAATSSGAGSGSASSLSSSPGWRSCHRRTPIPCKQCCCLSLSIVAYTSPSWGWVRPALLTTLLSALM